MFEIIEEAAIAFVLIFICTYAIYAFGKRSAPKTTVSESGQASYACGERATFHGLKINVSLYKYLIYFVIFDSAVLVLAFAAFNLGTSALYLFLYLGIILAAGLVLLEGGDKE